MLTLICGFPRAGKTTYSRQFEGLCEVVHLDTCGRYSGVRKRIERSQGSVVVDGIYDTADRRTDLLQAYKGQGARCVWIDTPLEVRKARHGYIGRNEHFEPPTFAEGWDEIIRITNYERSSLKRKT